jgi:BirA family biotin operon repressor/biotin-[acetyl-CoA-carboxylase] ligase
MPKYNLHKYKFNFNDFVYHFKLYTSTINAIYNQFKIIKKRGGDIPLKTREQILNLLIENKGVYISGEKIANSLNISRTAVWKCINEIKNNGYNILSISKKGYCYDDSNDILSTYEIEKNLNQNCYNIILYKTIKSTNQTAKEFAQQGDYNNTIILSEEQTEGRGRLGRSFYSPSNTGIYMSILIRPKLDINKGLLVTSCAAVAVCKAIENLTDIQPKIKWVNDIYIENKKVCGILTESSLDFESGTLDYVIIGIGINFTTLNFPDTISNSACSIFEDTKFKFSRNILISEIINQFFPIINTIDDEKNILDYKKRSNILGEEIEITNKDKVFFAKAVDIDKNGFLIIENKDKTLSKLNTGEITIRKK